MSGVRRLVTRLGAALLAWSCVSAVGAADSTLFPEYEAIQGNVTFWIRIFSEWRLDQAVVHDVDHPDLTYEVLDLPGAVEGRYTREQEAFLEQALESWSDYLEYLEEKVDSERELSALEQQWVEHVTSIAGEHGLVGAHQRLRTQRGLRERFREGLERSARYDELFRQIFREEGLPEDLAYLPHVESSFQWHARSSVGATGLWQFTRGTGRRYLKINSVVDERLDPIIATRGAARYLRNAYDALGSWPLALTAYNHGIQGMKRAKDAHGDYETAFREYRGRLFGFASKNFYSEFLAAREIASNPEAYFPEGYVPQDPVELDSVVLERRATPRAVAQTYGVALDELRELNLAWSDRAIKRNLALPSGSQIWLPQGTVAQLAGNGGPLPVPPEATAGHHEATYLVRRGDNLSAIADRHDMTVAELRELNNLSRSSSLIRPGQRLIVLTDAVPTVHVVRRGDTLSTIAARYGMKVSDIRRANNIPAHSSIIREGQRLVLTADAVPTVHVVRRGDTLSTIAARHGMKVSDIRRANNIPAHSSIIREGQRLRLPSGGERRHVVRRGDTLLEIASRYGVRLMDLLHLNTLDLNSVIHPGQQLQIP